MVDVMAQSPLQPSPSEGSSTAEDLPTGSYQQQLKLDPAPKADLVKPDPATRSMQAKDWAQKRADAIAKAAKLRCATHLAARTDEAYT